MISRRLYASPSESHLPHSPYNQHPARGTGGRIAGASLINQVEGSKLAFHMVCSSSAAAAQSVTIASLGSVPVADSDPI